MNLAIKSLAYKLVGDNWNYTNPYTSDEQTAPE